jgi:hypothetical protein
MLAARMSRAEARFGTSLAFFALRRERELRMERLPAITVGAVRADALHQPDEARTSSVASSSNIFLASMESRFGITSVKSPFASRKPSGSEIQMNMTHEVRTSSAKNTDIRNSRLWLQKYLGTVPDDMESSGLPTDLQLGPMSPAS